MILLEEASYRYPGAAAWALGPISLELRPGEVVGVRGANESGKSTLCLLVSGMAPAAIGGEVRGRVLVDGRPTSELPPHELARRCGLLFDNPAVQLTDLHRIVYDEVAFGPCNLGLPEAEAHASTRSALELLDIGHLAERHPRRLSGGESQLVALAGLLALGPAYLALDEPTSRLDAERSALVAAAIERVAAAGVGVLVAEHDEVLLARLCDRVVDLGRPR
jgi:energy-coupling factor transporter ATP-binding protein EcfA2